VATAGVAGDTALGAMPGRLQAQLKRAADAGAAFDWVLLMAGINDLYQGSGSQEVFEGLQVRQSLHAPHLQDTSPPSSPPPTHPSTPPRLPRPQAMYRASRAAGASVLAMTLLPVEKGKGGFFDPSRLEEQPHVNRLIRSVADGSQGLHLLDWEDALPTDWLDGSSASGRYYDDGVSPARPPAPAGDGLGPLRHRLLRGAGWGWVRLCQRLRPLTCRLRSAPVRHPAAVARRLQGGESDGWLLPNCLCYRRCLLDSHPPPSNTRAGWACARRCT
jgi:hypothetical protein